jgi:hypothetical protein
MDRYFTNFTDALCICREGGECGIIRCYKPLEWKSGEASERARLTRLDLRKLERFHYPTTRFFRFDTLERLLPWRLQPVAERLKPWMPDPDAINADPEAKCRTCWYIWRLDREIDAKFSICYRLNVSRDCLRGLVLAYFSSFPLDFIIFIFSKSNTVNANCCLDARKRIENSHRRRYDQGHRMRVNARNPDD